LTEIVESLETIATKIVWQSSSAADAEEQKREQVEN
jgi:hypothetical protein